jgi:hypothetical protein
MTVLEDQTCTIMEKKHTRSSYGDPYPDSILKNMASSKVLYYRRLYSERPDPIVFQMGKIEKSPPYGKGPCTTKTQDFSGEMNKWQCERFPLLLPYFFSVCFLSTASLTHSSRSSSALQSRHPPKSCTRHQPGRHAGLQSSLNFACDEEAGCLCFV